MTTPPTSQWHGSAAAALSSAALLCLAALLYESAPLPPRLDASFPTAPTAHDFAVLRDAYSAPPASWPRPRLLEGAKFVEMAPLDLRPQPEGKDADLVRLGRQLFEDPRLSASGQIACQSCHNRRLGWGDGLPTSFGHARATGKRNAPSLFSAGYKSTFLWDGRAQSLEEQALGPLADQREMANHDFTGLLERVNASDRYRKSFAKLTGSGDEITLQQITHAIAAFERTLERTTRFDRFMQGNAKALTDQQIWGLHVFRTKAGCANCHNGPTLSDNKFHNLGLSYFNRKLEDLGRFGVTRKTADAGSFLTPSLRHVSKTGPYMHNGVFPSLEGLINLYQIGGGRVRPDHKVPPDRVPLLKAVLIKSPQLQPFQLTREERAALVAFLNTL